MARNAKNNKTIFYRFVGQKRKIKEKVSPLVNKTGPMKTINVEKADILNHF